MKKISLGITLVGLGLISFTFLQLKIENFSFFTAESKVTELKVGSGSIGTINQIGNNLLVNERPKPIIETEIIKESQKELNGLFKTEFRIFLYNVLSIKDPDYVLKFHEPIILCENYIWAGTRVYSSGTRYEFTISCYSRTLISITDGIFSYENME